MKKEILRKFVRDYRLPIGVLEEPYFLYFMNLYDRQYQTKRKLQLLMDTIIDCGGESAFMEAYWEVKEKVFEIKKTEAFRRFTAENFTRFNIYSQYPKGDIFKTQNNGKYFVSVDLEKANFQALRFFDKDLVCQTDSYEEFLRIFTDKEYFIASKYIRQVIFGNMNPKRQVIIERYLIEQVLQELFKSALLTNNNIISDDEIVFETTEPLSQEKEAVIKNIGEKIGVNLRIECFKLTELSPHPFFVKEFTNKKGVKFKNIPQIYFPQAFKHYFGMDINEYDLTFSHEGRLVRFLEPLTFNYRLRGGGK